MGFLKKDTEERAAKASAKAIADQLQASAKAIADQLQAEAREREREQREAAEIQDRASVESFPKWEYQVVRVGEDMQKGLLGSRPMEQILNDEGRKGWELVTVNEERATFKRRIS